MCYTVDHKFTNIIQILTGTVMKYQISMNCQESHFPKGLYFPEVRNTWENIAPRNI